MTSWIAETMIATTVLMIAVLALRAPVTQIFGARAAYLLWLAPAVRMILPPLPQGWFGAPLISSGSDVAANAAAVMAGATSPAPFTAAAAGGGTAWLVCALAVWLGGAAFFFGHHLMSYRRFKRGVMASAEPLFLQGRIPVSTSAAVTSPIALGIIGRAVIVPADFGHRYDATEQRLALHHEVTHHRRGDLGVNLGALAMLALHWFNPIAHFAHRAFRHDQEAACDAIVLAGASADERHAYGTALFKSATGSVPLSVCAMGTATTLKARLRRILMLSNRPERLLAGSALAVAAIGGGLFFTASEASVVAASETVSISSPVLALNRVEIDAVRASEEAQERAQEARGRAQEAAERAADAQHVTKPGENGSNEAQKAAEQAQSAADGAWDAAQQGAQAAREAQAEARRAIASVSKIRARCPDEQSSSMSVSIERDDQNEVRIISCGRTIHDSAAMRAEILKGLKEARAEMEREQGLSEKIRARVLASLDRQIASFWPRWPVRPSPPVPPAASQAPAAPAAPAPPLPLY